jgi:hypothetical protein
MAPRVELLFWDGCPSLPRALDDLRAALAAARLDADAIELIEIRDDGRDVVDTGGEPVQLACRVYRRRDGSVSPVPDPDDLRRALEGARA